MTGAAIKWILGLDRGEESMYTNPIRVICN